MVVFIKIMTTSGVHNCVTREVYQKSGEEGIRVFKIYIYGQILLELVCVGNYI